MSTVSNTFLSEGKTIAESLLVHGDLLVDSKMVITGGSTSVTILVRLKEKWVVVTVHTNRASLDLDVTEVR